MARQFRFAAGIRTAALLVALLALGPSVALAQAPLGNVTAAVRDDKAAKGVATPASEQLSEARAQLQQAIRARDEAGESDPGRQPHPSQIDRQRLLDWLVDRQREKVKRLEELDALQAMAKSPADADPLVKALGGPPPYSAVQVDALRDEIDGLQEKLAAAEASYRANQTELQDLHAQLKARAAVARRADEPPLGTRTLAQEEQAQGEREMARLLERIAEVEIALTALDQQRLTLHIAALRGRVEDMQAVVTRVLPHQQLSPQELAAQRQRVRREGERLAGEIHQTTRRTSQFRAARDRLNGEAGTSGRQAAYLDVAIKTDNAVLKGLDLLQLLNGVSGDIWEKRYVLLTSADPDQGRAALESLKELRQKLADWRSLSRTRQDTLQTEIRAQRIRVDNLAGDGGDLEREKDILNLLLRQTAMDERVELAAARLEKQVSRWLADFAEPADLSGRDRVLRIRDQVAALLKRIWQQELFVAEDVSEVDGRQVSVKYGVTVGKSVGILVVFVVAYWLLAVISRFIQHQLVRWFKVSPQLASVLRRWSMIGLSLALVVLLLNLARIPLSVFAFLGGALAIGVGFGAQTIIKNFISGLIVLFERKVRVGDVVELGGVAGHVTAVDLRATTVLGFNGVEALIPNANFIENQVVNWTYSNRRVRRELTVDIAYGSDVRQAEALFLAAAAEHAWVLRDPAPEVFFDGFGDSALKVVLVYWVEFDGAKGPRRVDSDLRHDLYGRLAAAGISIPFPQREVRVSLAQPLVVGPPDVETIRAG
jgi:small-conductance mechanosensitive channel